MSLRVVLVQIWGIGPLFLAKPERHDSSAPPSRGVFARMARKREAILADLSHPRGFLGKALGRVWNWLQRFVEHDEHILRGLRVAEDLIIDYSAGMPTDEVMSLWRAYLLRRRNRHLGWLIADGLMAPASLLLTPLPGPNLVSYWLFYRVVVHFLAMRGASRARAGKIPTTTCARHELDVVLVSGDDEPVAEISRTLNFPDLATALARVVPPRPDPSPE